MHKIADSPSGGFCWPSRACTQSGAAKSFCNAFPRVFNGTLSGVVFSNEARGGEIIVAGALDGSTVAANESDGWYRLASYRDYPNVRGMQRVDETAANAMVQDFSSAVTRIKRFFGSHSPAVYRGHPDDGTYSGHDDTTIYGNVDSMEARPDGVYAHIQWNPAYDTIRGKEPWRLSPRWAMQTVANGIWRPVRLVSIGLTTQPQLPDAAFANSTEDETTMTLLEMILAKLGFAPERIAATKTGGDGAVTPEEAEAALAKLNAASKAEADKAKAETAAANARVGAIEAEKAAAIALAANERKARASAVLDEAIAKGRIPASKREEWSQKLCAAGDFTVAANELASQKPALHTAAQFGNQGTRRSVEVITASNEMSGLVEEHMSKTGGSWTDSWTAVSQTEKGRNLLKAMQPGA